MLSVVPHPSEKIYIHSNLSLESWRNFLLGDFPSVFQLCEYFICKIFLYGSLVWGWGCTGHELLLVIWPPKTSLALSMHALAAWAIVETCWGNACRCSCVSCLKRRQGIFCIYILELILFSKKIGPVILAVLTSLHAPFFESWSGTFYCSLRQTLCIPGSAVLIYLLM
jgi:hypothetical protein